MNKFSHLFGIDALTRKKAAHAATNVVGKLGVASALEKLANQMGEWAETADKQYAAGELAEAAATVQGALLGSRMVLTELIKNMREGKEPGQ